MEKTIKIDKEGPKFETGIERSEVSDTGFTINVLATDSLSGNSKYNGKVTYKYIILETGTTNKKEETNDTGNLTCSDLKTKTRYDIEVIASDLAGNSTSIKSFIVPGGSSSGGGNQGGNTGDGGNQGGTDPDNPDKPPVDPNDPNNPDNYDPDPDGDDGIVETGTLQRPTILLTKTSGKLANGKYYTGGVRILITDSVASNISTAEVLRYEVIDSGGNDVTPEGKGTWNTSDGRSTYFDFEEEGAFTIKAWAEDSIGSKSRVRESQIIIDKTPPEPPTITVNGTHGPNATDESYVGRIIVSIKPTTKDANGNKDTSGIWGIKYQVTGDNTIKETRVAGTGTYNITISKVGVSAVLAYTIDNATNQSELATQEVERVAQEGDEDVGDPAITLTPTLTTEDSIVVTAKVTGDVPGITQYRFDYKESSTSQWQTASTRVTDYTTYGYTYSGLTSGKEYNIRVTATDTDGEPLTSEVQTVKAEYNDYVSPINISDTSLIGRTVDYIPDNTTFTAYLYNTASPSTISIQNSGWTIWGTNSEDYVLVPKTPAVMRLTSISYRYLDARHPMRKPGRLRFFRDNIRGI